MSLDNLNSNTVSGESGFSDSFGDEVIEKAVEAWFNSCNDGNAFAVDFGYEKDNVYLPSVEAFDREFGDLHLFRKAFADAAEDFGYGSLLPGDVVNEYAESECMSLLVERGDIDDEQYDDLVDIGTAAEFAKDNYLSDWEDCIEEGEREYSASVEWRLDQLFSGARFFELKADDFYPPLSLGGSPVRLYKHEQELPEEVEEYFGLSSDSITYYGVNDEDEYCVREKDIHRGSCELALLVALHPEVLELASIDELDGYAGMLSNAFDCGVDFADIKNQDLESANDAYESGVPAEDLFA